jgi:hypothetical protein
MSFYSFKIVAFRAGAVGQVIKQHPGKIKALSSNSSTTPQKMTKEK